MEPLRWILHYPKWPLIWLCALAGSVVLGLSVHWGFWFVVALAAGMNGLYWARVRDHFVHGCINASVVVDIDPLTIAVGTDLACFDGEYPAVKILEKRLSSLYGRSPVVGMRVGVVSLYEPDVDDEDSPCWVDFDPRPIECATGDITEQQRCIDSVPEDSWTQLEAMLGRLERPYELGLHRLW